MRTVILVSLIAFSLDQLSKLGVTRILGLNQHLNIAVLPPYIQFRYGENRGINFGLLSDAPDVMRWVLVVFSALVVLAVGWWVRKQTESRAIVIAAGLLIGGALGNAIDRLLLGHVIDFLNMSCCRIENPYVFNLADVFIVCGALGLVIFEGRERRRR
ncbi:MAG: signal peptidase II [Aestuariivita sp.]|nr:signal peptidase II [Aestuariivita sp.]MCY4203297.1 signal peptidase II [Aestuariivita sp.]